MANTFLTYPLNNGYLDHWLVAGPLSSPVSEQDLKSGDQPQAEIARRFYSPDSGVTVEPVELGPLGEASKDDQPLLWHYFRCREDHFIDLTTSAPSPVYLRAWAYARLICPSATGTALNFAA